MLKQLMLAGLLIFSQSHAFSQASPTDILTRFFSLYKQKDSNEAIDYLFSNNGYTGEMKDGIDDLKRKLKKQTDAMGLYYGYDSLSMRSAGSNYLKYTFLIRHARQPILFHFIFYKADNRWQAQTFSYSTDVSEELDEASKLYRLKENFN